MLLIKAFITAFTDKKERGKKAMYSNETLRKVTGSLKEKIAYYMGIDENDYRISISAGNRKIGRALNVSLAPIITCANCSQCMKFCYDVKACFMYPNVIDARARNTALLLKNRDLFFSLIDEKMSKRKNNKFLRFHVSGEIIDYDYFDRMVKLARKHPDFIIWTYTKVYWIVNEWINKNGDSKKALPKNFIVMFSEWRGTKMINPYGLPEFRVVFESDEIKPKGFYCPGNCDICKAKKTGCIAGKNVYCNEH